MTKKEMKVVVSWDGKITMNVTKSFENKIDGYKELAWVFRSAKEMVEGKDIGVDLSECGFISKETSETESSE